jgi:Xaa-Pro aminopeptidase
MFSATTYSTRRNRLKQEIDSGLVLLLGNDESPMSYTDNPYPFRQDSTFLYLFGLDSPGLAGVIDIDSGDEMIFGSDQSIDDIVWMGAKPTLAERSLMAGIERTVPIEQLCSVVSTAAAKKREIHFLPPYRPENRIKLHQLLGLNPATVGEQASLPLIRAVVAQRNIKSDEEVAEIEKAVDTSVDMHLAAMRMARPGVVEIEIVAEIERIARAAGGQTSFPPILTVHGQILHNHDYSHTLASGDLVLCDCGAETGMHYAGDLSSTIPVDPTLSSQQQEIYELTLRAHVAAVSALAPGVPFKEVHLLTCRVIAQGMKDMGLMRGSIDDAVAEGAHAMFFPCGLGHMLGLDVHDMEDLGEVHVGYDGKSKSTQFGLKSLRLARKLEPGFVLTIEPGIYFIPELIDRWQAEGRFADFIDYDRVAAFRDVGGMRNEENFLLTDNGARRLGKPKPKTLKEMTAARRAGGG